MNTSLNKGIVLGSLTRTASASSEGTKNFDSVGPLGDLPITVAGTRGVNLQFPNNTLYTDLVVHDDFGHCELTNLMVERVEAWDVERSSLVQQCEFMAQDLKKERENTIAEKRKVFEEREKVIKEKERADKEKKRVEEVKEEVGNLKEEKSSLEIKLKEAKDSVQIKVNDVFIEYRDSD
ncbi:hypothetical protein NE237_026660 [Protea cynaroides]|uniref:Uncharacterized protein n=1 Tax=Protea cynaroides TaxID=273540 RepID=A0A9Q0H5G1_9MAGN|nr:hypothetical protein NE237_026660 [Protea cynaroides]